MTHFPKGGWRHSSIARLPSSVALAVLASCASMPQPVPPPAPPAPRGVQQQATGSALRWVGCVDCEAPTAKTMPSAGATPLAASSAMPRVVAQLISKAQAAIAASPAALVSAAATATTEPAPVAQPQPRKEAPANTESTLVRSTVTFGLDEATLSQADRERLRQLKPLLAEAKRVRITGYTDGQGGTESNDRLASRRALAVVLFLRDGLGLSGPELTGSGRPLCCYRAPNTSEGGRAQNRRAELDIELPSDSGSEALIKQHASRLTPARSSGAAS